jgi:hypothetical protein
MIAKWKEKSSSHRECELCVKNWMGFFHQKFSDKLQIKDII